MNNDDLRYISDCNLWVNVVCPLKRRRDSWFNFAYLIGDGPILHHGNIFDMRSSDRLEAFDSYKAILDAGWEVD